MYQSCDCLLCDGDTKYQREVSASCNCKNGDGGEKCEPVNAMYYLEFSQSEIMFKMSSSDSNVSSNPGVSTKTTCR